MDSPSSEADADSVDASDIGDTNASTDTGARADSNTNADVTEADVGLEDTNPNADDTSTTPEDTGDQPPEIPFQTDSTITTTLGEAEGFDVGDLRVFKGIPFAKPPVEDLRFQAPQPAEPWDGVLSADAFGPSCLQAISLNSNGTSEDCLTLNVWAHRDDEPRPIMVWIYGGGFVIGETAMGTYDGADLAKTADVVVVSLNYRLGVFGNLALPELRDEDPLGAIGNMGLLDQIEALRWIKANAAAFGGDPDNITVFGESAGAISTCALIGSPLADDLFHKAIMQSGNCTLFAQAEGDGLLPGAPNALGYGERIVDELGCSGADDRLACLRALPAEELLNVVGIGALLNLFEAEASLGWTIDGAVLPKSPYARITAGEAPARPVLAGSNGNEAFIFTATQTILTRRDFRNMIAPVIGGEEVAEQIVDLYPLLTYPIAKDAFTAFVGEWMFNCNTYHAVRSLGGSGYYYELGVGPTLLMTPFGPLHGADIFYVFGNFLASGIVPTLVDLDLSSKIQLAWGTFARTGVPVWEGGWPPTRADNPEFLRIDLFPGVADEFRSGRCDELQRLGALP